MLCFDKLTGKHNNKKHLKFFVLREYIFESSYNKETVLEMRLCT